MKQFSEDELGLMLYSLIRVQQKTTAVGSRQWVEFSKLIEKLNTEILDKN